MTVHGRRGAPDASMDLLNQIMRQPVDPDYAVVAARGAAPSRGRWKVAVVAVAAGAMFSVAAVQTTRTASVLESERTELIARIKQSEAEQDRLRSRAQELGAEIAQLRIGALGGDETARTLRRRITTLETTAGTVAVTGPGLVVVVDDAPSGGGNLRDRVLDRDIQILANGLWRAGAEAVSVNGHRLSALTAIRSAGDAITVDYRSLTPPYRVEAIGDPRTLPAAWVESAGGAWWHELAQNRGMRYEISTVDEMTLGADPGVSLRYARSS
jgi:uncharacterized protein YlxW (UPF0749 family)